MTAKLRVAAIVTCLVVLTGLVLLLARPELLPAQVAGTARIQPIELVGLAWVVFGCAVWLARGAAVKAVTWLVLVGGIVLQLAALTGPPQNSSDLYRYIWDGRVQVAGVDPYLYAPGDSGVAGLRNEFLWYPLVHQRPDGFDQCVPDEHNRPDPPRSLVAGCTRINRPKVPTIYPPVAEAYFTGIQVAAPADDSTTPVQAGAAAFAVLTTLMLLSGLRRYGRDPRLAALWAWCPTVVLEAGQNGHVDIVAVALTTAGLLVLAGAASVRRNAVGGALLGLAIATKLTPAFVMPAVLRRGWRAICAAAAAAVILVYVPHVIAVGSKITGFLPGYLDQEGYSGGTAYAVIGLFAQGPAATVIAAVILGLVALAVIRYSDPDRPWRGALLMTVAALAVTTPRYQWYALLLVMLVALDGHPEWLAIAAGGYLANSPHLYIHGFLMHDSRLIGYGGGTLVACALALLRMLVSRTRAPEPGTDAIRAGDAQAVADEAGDVVWAGEPAEPRGAGAVAGGADDASHGGERKEDGGGREEGVIEPTAVIVRPTVTIGTGGLPDFSAEPDADRDKDSGIADSYRVLTESELPERGGRRHPSIGV